MDLGIWHIKKKQPANGFLLYSKLATDHHRHFHFYCLSRFYVGSRMTKYTSGQRNQEDMNLNLSQSPSLFFLFSCYFIGFTNPNEAEHIGAKVYHSSKNRCRSRI